MKVLFISKADWNNRVPNNGKSYGNGFTLYGLLNNIDINRSDIQNKIKNKYFDKIVYGYELGRDINSVKSITNCVNIFHLTGDLNFRNQASNFLISNFY